MAPFLSLPPLTANGDFTLMVDAGKHKMRAFDDGLQFKVNLIRKMRLNTMFKKYIFRFYSAIRINGKWAESQAEEEGMFQMVITQNPLQSVVIPSCYCFIART